MKKIYPQNRNSAVFTPPFKIGASSMVYGENLLENANLLASMVDHVEIILFFTQTLHNFPSLKEIKYLKKLGADEDLSYSVHLPASLEIASANKTIREKSVQMVVDLVNHMNELNPMYHILHIPFTRPTLTAIPGQYLTTDHQDKFIDWTLRATESLETIRGTIGQSNQILVENINYSPIFLERFWKLGLCGFCLDMGHLMLGQERVSTVTRQFISAIQEIHLHGVKANEEHLSLAVLPKTRLAKWVALLIDTAYKGVVNLEVFSAESLESSLNVLIELLMISEKINTDNYLN